MNSDDFDGLLDDYLSGRVAPNPEMVAAEIVWVRGDPDVGSDHIAQHDVSEAEVEEVLLEVPPYVAAKRHQDHPDRTIFWGATRAGRWLFVACVDWTEGETFLETHYGIQAGRRRRVLESAMIDEPSKSQDLAEEAKLWDERKLTPAGWVDAPEAVPRVGESIPISIRLPRAMIAILKEFAKREGVGYQVLIKHWLDDRVCQESERRKTEVRFSGPVIRYQAAVFHPLPQFTLTEEARLDEVGRIASRLPAPE